MKAQQFLAEKGNGALVLDPEETLADAALRFSETPEGRKYTVAVVTNPDNQILGMLSLGDIAHALAVHKRNVTTKTVAEVMSKDNCVAHPDDDLQDLLKIMAAKEVRHIPVVSDGQYIGLIARRDAMEALYNEAMFQLKNLTEYVFRSGARY